jgi:hypothetical protein
VTGESFASTSLSLNVYFEIIEATGMTSLPNFIKIYQLVQKLIGGDRHTKRMI